MYINVICTKNNSTKLIKGATYVASALYTYSNRRTLYITDIGNYSADNFVLEDGSSLKNIKDFKQEYNSLDLKGVNYTGQFVRCGRYSSSKTLKPNEVYYVEEHKVIQKRYTYNSSNTYEDHKFKIRGIRNLVNAYNFVQIPITEQRHLKLKNLAGTPIKTGEQTRKFLLYSEKEKHSILLVVFSSAISDISKIQNTEKINIQTELKNFMIKKGRKYDIKDEDIETFLEKNLKDIVNLICK